MQSYRKTQMQFETTNPYLIVWASCKLLRFELKIIVSDLQKRADLLRNDGKEKASRIPARRVPWVGRNDLQAQIFPSHHR